MASASALSQAPTVQVKCRVRVNKNNRPVLVAALTELASRLPNASTEQTISVVVEAWQEWCGPDRKCVMW